MKKNKIVIVLVNYNTNGDTIDCIKSIQKSAGVELPFIVLVDNNSKNAKGLECFKEEYSKLHIIYNEENLGFGRANNKGINWAQENIDFEYLLLLNNDTIVEPDSLYYLKEAFKKDCKIGITTSKTMYEGQRDIVWYGGGFINCKRGWPKIMDFNKTCSFSGANTSKYVSFASGCVMMFNKDSINKIKGFDQSFFMYCEDLELCMRAYKLGCKIYYESKSIIYHKVQASLKSNGNKVTGMRAGNPNLPFLFFNMKTNQYKTMKIHTKGYQFFVFNIFYSVDLLYRTVVLFVKGRFDIIKIVYSVIKFNLYEKA